VPDEILKKGSDLTPAEWNDHEAASDHGREDLPSVEVVAAGAFRSFGIITSTRMAAATGWAAGGRDSRCCRAYCSGGYLRCVAHGSGIQAGTGHEQAAVTMRDEAQSGLWDEELVAEFFGMLGRAACGVNHCAIE